ncbi:TPA: hypothetical protein I8Y21_002241 [Klebsiella oxytoca]|uniref:Phage tail protein n=1 Tax=Klebsiella oxytoca TaxID=571 RepID=A0AAN5L792_KLEOX|nr:hypothetical protein [Klebsiella oxytoca]
MRKIGDITPTADDQGEFTDGNVTEYIQPTLLMAAWFNAVQRELCNVVGFDGTKPDGTDDSQVLEAIERLVTREIKKIKLGTSAALDVGTTAGTVAAGDDSRITGALQAGKCLQELKEAGATAQRLSLSNIGGFPASGGTISGDTTVQGTVSASGGFHAGEAQFAVNGDAYGGLWGGWLSAWLNNAFANRATIDWVRQSFISGMRFSAEKQVGAVGVYTYHENTVLTGFNNRDADYSTESLFWSYIQVAINGQWVTIGR